MASRSKANVCVVFCVSILLSFPLGLLAGQGDRYLQLERTGRTVSEGQRSIVFGGAFQPGVAMPVWDKGYLIVRKLVTLTAGTPNVWLYNAAGNEVREAAIWMPGSTRVIVVGAAATSDGRIVVAGSAEQEDSSLAFFIALTDMTGNIIKVIQTNPYVAGEVCVMPDGTVWTAGGIRSRSLQEQAAAAVLRHFDFDRGLIGSYLPRSLMMKSNSPITYGGPGRELYFGCDSDRVVLYSGISNQYVELTTSNNEIRQWKLDRSLYDLPIGGFALTATSEVYGSLYAQGKPSSNDGLYYLQHDDSAGTVRWMPVENNDPQHFAGQSFGRLYGADGDFLVHSGTGEDYKTVYWSPLSRGTR